MRVKGRTNHVQSETTLIKGKGLTTRKTGNPSNFIAVPPQRGSSSSRLLIVHFPLLLLLLHAAADFSVL